MAARTSVDFQPYNSLIYHALHILLRRQILNTATARDRPEHLSQCIAHSKEIHAIHTLYTRTFPHRLMTYQVSYCIYTAATVEALELKNASMGSSDRAMVAERLLAAVMVLQKEASHTPGSGKSLDTIRRLLSEGPPQLSVRETLQPLKRRKWSRCDSDAAGIVRSGFADEASRTSEEQEITAEDGSGRPGGGTAQISEVVGGGSAAGQPDVTTAMGAVQEMNSGEMAGWDVDLGFSGNFDTGAGFHPDSFSWGMADSFPRFPPQANTTSTVSAAVSSAPAGLPPATAPYHPTFANSQGWYGL